MRGGCQSPIERNNTASFNPTQSKERGVRNPMTHSRVLLPELGCGLLIMRIGEWVAARECTHAIMDHRAPVSDCSSAMTAYLRIWGCSSVSNVAVSTTSCQGSTSHHGQS